MMLCAWGRVWFARTIAGMSARYWLKRILLPLLFVFVLVLFAGWLLQLWIDAGLVRIVLSTIVCEMVLVVLSWLLVLNQGEKELIRDKVLGILHRKR